MAAAAAATQISILKRLNHRHIVHLREVLASSTKLYLVMDYVNGGELFDLLEKKGALEEDEARRFFHQLVDAINYCHSVGVSHRDLKVCIACPLLHLLPPLWYTLSCFEFQPSPFARLWACADVLTLHVFIANSLLLSPSLARLTWCCPLQPENLMLCRATGELKITDFGFSAMRSTIDQMLTTQCGTPDYIAPEVIDVPAGGYSGAKADVWSIGVILYMLIVGQLPFSGRDSDALFDAIMNCRVTYPPSISPGARAVLERLLVLDPASRASLEEVKTMPWYQFNRLASSREPRATRGARIVSYNRAARRLVMEPSAAAAVDAGAPLRTDAPAPADRPPPLLPSVASAAGAHGAAMTTGAAGQVSGGGSNLSLISVPTMPSGGAYEPIVLAAAEVDSASRLAPQAATAAIADPPSSPLPQDADDMDGSDDESDDAMSTAVTFIQDEADAEGGGDGQPAVAADVADVPSPTREVLASQAPSELPDRATNGDDTLLPARQGGDYPGPTPRDWHVSDMSEDSVAFRLRGSSPGTPPGPVAVADGGLAGSGSGGAARSGQNGRHAPLTSRDSSQVSVAEADRGTGEPPRPSSPMGVPPLFSGDDSGRIPFRRPTLGPAVLRRNEPAADRSTPIDGGWRSPSSPLRGGGGSGGGGAHLLTSAGVSLIRKTSALLHQAAHASSSSAPTSPRSDTGSPTLGGPPTPPAGGQPPAKVAAWRRRVGGSSGRSSRGGSGASSPVLPPAPPDGVLVVGSAAGAKRPRQQPVRQQPTRALPPLYDGTVSHAILGETQVPSHVGGPPTGAAADRSAAAASSGADGAAPWPVAPGDDLGASRRSSVSDWSRRSSYDAKTVNSARVQQSTTTGSHQARRPQTPNPDGTPRLSISSSSDGDLPSVLDFRERPVQLVSFGPLGAAPDLPSVVASPSPPPSPPPPVQAPPMLAPLLPSVDASADRSSAPLVRGLGDTPGALTSTARSRGPFADLRLPPGATSSPIPPLSSSPYGTSPVKEDPLSAGRSLAVHFSEGLRRWRAGDTPAAEVAEDVEALLDFLPGLASHHPAGGAEAERFRGGQSALRAFVVELSHSVSAGAADTRCASPPGGVAPSVSDGGSSAGGEEGATGTAASRSADGQGGREMAVSPGVQADGHSDGESSADTMPGQERRRRQVSDLLRKVLINVGGLGGGGGLRPSSPALSDPCLGSSASGSSGRLRRLGSDMMLSDDDCSIANIQAALMQMHGGRQESNLAAELETLVAYQRQTQAQQEQQQEQQRQHRLQHHHGGGGPAPRASSQLASQLAHMSQSLPPSATPRQGGLNRRPEVQTGAVRSTSDDTFIKLTERASSATSHRVRSDMTCLPQAYVPSRASVSDCEGSEGVRVAMAQVARARAAARLGESGTAGGAFDPYTGSLSSPLVSAGGPGGFAPPGGGSRGGEGDSRPAMAVSMGLSNVAYYDSGENGRGLSGHGLTRQVRQRLVRTLLGMRNRNHKLAEEMTHFNSFLSLATLVQVLGRTLSSMGGEVTLQRNTRRKLKYRTVFAHKLDHCGQWTTAYESEGGGGGGGGGSAAPTTAAADALTLCAVVDVEGEDGVEGRVPQDKAVYLRRSREDPRRVSTALFQSFFHSFHARFLHLAACQTGEEPQLPSPTRVAPRPGGAGGGKPNRRHRSRASSAAAVSGVVAGVALLHSAQAT